jgi:asparagine synthase (glutamine-hydrolysing)
MCGIIGCISTQIENTDWIENGLRNIHHRGPDDSGIWKSDHELVTLGHVRLSILDLSTLGHQPMEYLDKGITIVFNGEIYNYLELRNDLKSKGYNFKTNTDTEVLMGSYLEWGVDFLTRLNGMFAFCLYDSNKEEVLLARDRAGEKPLFYSLEEKSIKFCSELKGLLADSKFVRKINPSSLDCLLSQGYVAGEMCIFEKAKKLPPACALLFDIKTGKNKVWDYWKLPSNLAELSSFSSSAFDDDLLNELDFLLSDSINKQLVADVPVGVLLSGGVDSSLITAYAAKCQSNLKTFTVTFPQYSKFDESKHAKIISNHFGTNHFELEASEITPDILFNLAEQFDEPMVDSSMIPTYLVTKLVKEHCTVALGGDGGDELFGGYGHHSRLLWMNHKSGMIPMPIRKILAIGARDILPIGFKGRVWLQGLGENLETGLPLIANLFEPNTRKLLLSKYPGWNIVAENIRQEFLPKNVTNLLDRVTRMDFKNYMPEDILVKVDRSSMLNSLEMRAPFLDHRIIDFAFEKVPMRLKANTNERKIILKKIAERVLPKEFDKKRKQGFGIPIGEWMRKGTWNDFFYDNLVMSQTPFFNQSIVRSLFDSHLKGAENTERLFGLLMFQLWINKYKSYL